MMWSLTWYSDREGGEKDDNNHCEGAHPEDMANVGEKEFLWVRTQAPGSESKVRLLSSVHHHKPHSRPSC